MSENSQTILRFPVAPDRASGRRAVSEMKSAQSVVRVVNITAVDKKLPKSHESILRFL